MSASDSEMVRYIEVMWNWTRSMTWMKKATQGNKQNPSGQNPVSDNASETAITAETLKARFSLL